MDIQRIAILALLFVFGCQPKDLPMIPLLQDSPNCPIVVFKPGADDRSVQAFLEKVTRSVQDERHLLRPGISSLVNREVDGKVAYQVCFSQKGVRENLDNFVWDVRTSPLVEDVRIPTHHPQ